MSQTEFVIRPPQGHAINLPELWRYRSLIWTRVRKNIKSRYEDMFLSYFWAITQPLVVVAVFVWLKKVTSARMNVTLPYALFTFSGLILWYYFITATTAITTSAQRDANLLKRVYFPRLVSPTVALLENLFELCLAFGPLLVMMVAYRIAPGWRLIGLPLVIAQVMALSMGIGCMLAAWSLNGADVQRILRHVFYIGLFLSPVLLQPKSDWPWVYYANPMAGTLLAFRACLFEGFAFPLAAFAFSVLFSGVILRIGLRSYRRAESEFLDQL